MEQRPDEEIPDDFGLTEQPAAEAASGHPTTHEHERRDGAGHDDAQDHEHDHENMAFSMFKRTPQGEIVEIGAGDIERDTSGYDEGGHDRGRGPSRTEPPTPPTPPKGPEGPEPGHGGHHH